MKTKLTALLLAACLLTACQVSPESQSTSSDTTTTTTGTTKPETAAQTTTLPPETKSPELITELPADDGEYTYKLDKGYHFFNYDIRDAASLIVANMSEEVQVTVDEALAAAPYYAAQFDFAYATTTTGKLLTKENDSFSLKDSGNVEFDELYYGSDEADFIPDDIYKIEVNDVIEHDGQILTVTGVETRIYSVEQGYSNVTFGNDQTVTLTGYIQLRMKDEGYAPKGSLDFYPLPSSYGNLPIFKTQPTTLYKQDYFGIEPFAQLDTPFFRLNEIDQLEDAGIDTFAIPPDGSWGLVTITFKNLTISQDYGSFLPCKGEVLSIT
jgi:hypothetical protein